MLVCLLLITGRFDEAKTLAERGRDFNPEDETDVLVDAIREAVGGRTQQALQVLDRAGKRLDPPTRAAFESVLRLIGSLPRVTNPYGAILTRSDAFSLIQNIGRLLTNSNQFSIGLSPPPGLKQAYFQLIPSNLGLLFFDPASLATKMVATHRDGFTLYFYGQALLIKGDLTRAEPILLEAATTPSLIDVRTPARYLALRSGFQRWKFGGLPEQERSAYPPKFSESIGLLLTDPEIDSQRLCTLGQMAWQIGDIALLFRIAEKWRAVSPDELGPDLYLSYCAIERNSPLSAIEHATHAYAKRNKGAEFFKREGVDALGEIPAVLSNARTMLISQALRLVTDRFRRP